MALTVRPEHFMRTLPDQDARALFKASVEQVEIETFTYCNRVCWFCPNSEIDRRSVNHYMDEDLYLRILNDLRSIEYSGSITYSRYNEPLADRIILTRIRQARDALPKAMLFTHTNGDYLTRELLDELRDAGLNLLRVQVYLGNNDHFSDTAMLTRMAQRLKDLDLPFQFTDVRQNVYYSAKVRYSGMDVIFEARNFDLMGVDRGQTIDVANKHHRTSPCLIVFQHVYIDYNGAVVPCCNIRSDQAQHADYVVDHLVPGRSIFDAYANSPLADWRRSLLPFGEKQKPCDSCSFALLPDNPELRQTIDTITRQFGIAPA